MSHLFTFDCVIYVKNTRPHLKKLDGRSTKMVFVGYEEGSKAYRAYDPCTGHVHITCDAMFNELTQWDWSNGGDRRDGRAELFEIEFYTTTTAYEENQEQYEDGAGAVSPASNVTLTPPTPPASPLPLVEHVSPPSIEPDLDAEHDEDVSLRFHRIDNVLGPAAVPGLANLCCWKCCTQ
jgi:hypothetical protein